MKPRRTFLRRRSEDNLVSMTSDYFNIQCGTDKTSSMTLRYLDSEMTMEDISSRNGSRERLGLSFTIDYLLFNKGVKGSKEEATGSLAAEQTENNMLNHQKLEEMRIGSEIPEKRPQRSEADTEERKVKEEEGDENQQEGEEEVTTTTSTSGDPGKVADKPNQSYIALISKAILASEQKKLLLCDIYQWIMDHYPYFKSKVCPCHPSRIILLMWRAEKLHKHVRKQ